MSESATPIYHYRPMLPWSDSGEKRFVPILTIALALVIALGVVVPFIDVPPPDRKELEKLPPQLAKLIEKKKPETPKPKPKPPEPKPEDQPKPELPKPEVPKPEQPKPKPKPKVEAKPEERKKAQETVKEKLGTDALSSLAALAAAIPNAKLDTNNAALSNVGAKAVSAGSVVDPNAVIALSGGVDTGSLTTATSGESLGERQVTTVAVSKEEVRKVKEAGSKRTQEEMRLVFETNKQTFFNAYRRAQRSNPTLAGTVVLAVTIAPDGSVSSCEIGRSELKDDDLHKRLLSQCRRMQFKSRPGVEVAKVEFPINFIP
jgi:periplasmic protein TonB